MRATSTFCALPSNSASYSLRRFSSPITCAASLMRANKRSLTSFSPAWAGSVTVSGCSSLASTKKFRFASVGEADLRSMPSASKWSACESRSQRTESRACIACGDSPAGP